MTVRVTIDKTQGISAAKQLQKSAKNISNLDAVMRKNAVLLDKLVADTFRLQRTPDDKPWKPLKPGTIENRIRKRKGVKSSKKKSDAYRKDAKILVDTGRLKNSWYAKPYREANVQGIRVGTNTVYAKYHQAGGKVIPTREMGPFRWENGKWNLIRGGRMAKWLSRLRADLNKMVMKP